MEEQTFVRWVELPEAQPVRFDELPGLIAGALHEGPLAQAAAEINLDAELKALVDAGELMVRDPLTLGPQTFRLGRTLRASVLLPREDLGPLLASRGIGLRFTGAAAEPVLELDDSAAQVAADEAPPTAPASNATTPPPLTTPDIADAFDGINGQTAQQWRDKLGDVNNHQWLVEARAARASAPRPATWWPIKFAELLRARKATDESLDHAFLTVPKLKPWLPLWQEKRRERNAFGQ